MSWFDTSGIASLAKSALKEAQKTIDKALDIKDDEVAHNDTENLNAVPVDSNNEDFFSTWGISQSNIVRTTTSGSIDNEAPSPVITKSPTKTTAKINTMTASLWGSFTGSFFDNPKNENVPERTFQHTMSVESLADDSSDLKLIDEKFRHSKLVVREISEDGDETARVQSPGEGFDEEIDLSKLQSVNAGEIVTPEQVGTTDSKTSTVVKRKERPNSFHSNRLSVMSCDSGKNSSDSVEILGSAASGGTGCTTTPDSELTSVGQSVSTSSSVVGNKQTSDSVEILPDSLTSPSSVEVLGSEATNSNRFSQITDEEFVSPFESPVEHLNFKEDDFKISPDSIEIIPHGFEDEEQSVADDSISYMSISESTDATVLEPLPIKIENKFERSKLSREMVESINSDLSLSPDKNIMFGEPITQAPGRSTMHLPLSHTNMSNSQPIFPSSSNILSKELSRSAQALLNIHQTAPISNLIEPTNIINIPSDESLTSIQVDYQCESNDEGSQSDKTVMADNDAVGMESSTEDTTNSSNSFYLKNMLADAMIEKPAEASASQSTKLLDLSPNMMASSQEGLDTMSMSQLSMPVREQSPISSESRSDLVKIGSEQTSGHTSGDELETTTSSDIEIISSPNGDSSSAQSVSRHSPAKLQRIKCSGDHSTVELLYGKTAITKVKGHNRELSEASSHSDDSHSSEIDRLLKRISEMTEILEAREAKLIDTTRKNVELHELNTELKYQLETVLSKQMQSMDFNSVTEEYTQRMSALERKFQQVTREKDILKKQLEHTKQDAASRLSKGELETVIGEKDETIKELREEGEKLSKQQLQHSNIIKKLRAKEKDNESTIKHLRERVEELSLETDRLKRSLTAKDEVERSQIDAIHQLTAKNKKLESEINTVKSQLDDANQKMETFKKSLDSAKKELSENTRTNSELQARQQALENLETEQRLTQLQNEEVLDQLGELRKKLTNAEEEHLKKEQVLRKENVNLLRRLETAEARNEELAQSISHATKPFIRQLEALQTTHTMKTNSWETQEKNLLEKLGAIQDKLSAITERERSSREECFNLRSNVSSLETKLNTATNKLELLMTQMEQAKTDNLLALQDLTREKIALIEQDKINKKEMERLNSEINMLQEQLTKEKLLKNDDLKRSQTQERLQESIDQSSVFHQDSSPDVISTSPTMSLRRLSFSESLGSAAWLPDDHLDVSSRACTNVFEIENLQSSLKQRDGEVQQLQWELSRRENERTVLTTEISNLMVKLESLEHKVSDHESMKVQFTELQQQYDALCQMYGEKVEETQELRLDLQDVKEMYKMQIDELLQQNKNSS